MPYRLKYHVPGQPDQFPLEGDNPEDLTALFARIANSPDPNDLINFDIVDEALGGKTIWFWESPSPDIFKVKIIAPAEAVNGITYLYDDENDTPDQRLQKAKTQAENLLSTA